MKVKFDLHISTWDAFVEPNLFTAEFELRSVWKPTADVWSGKAFHWNDNTALDSSFKGDISC